MERKSGILMPISSLPSKHGIGTFGKEAYKFADFLQYRVIFLMYGQCQGGRQIHRTDSNNGFPVYDISAFCKVKRSFMTTQNMTQLLCFFRCIDQYFYLFQNKILLFCSCIDIVFHNFPPVIHYSASNASISSSTSPNTSSASWIGFGVSRLTPAILSSSTGEAEQPPDKNFL